MNFKSQSTFVMPVRAILHPSLSLSGD